MKHSTLWPTPTISYELSDIELGTLAECLSYYRKVHVEEFAYLEWLEMFVHPKTEILWTINYQFSFRRWDRLTDFRLTRLVLDLHFFDDEEVLVHVLPDLHHLKSLVLSFQHQLPYLATILARVAASKQLTEFELYKRDKQNYNFAITDSMVQDVLTWFRKQPKNGARRLFESLTDPERQVQMKWIGIGGNIILGKFEELKEFAAEKNVKLLTRVHEKDVAYNEQESNSEDDFYSDEEVFSQSADY
ncbi:unnamed protein product [Aphanomyces euteiches]